MHYSSNGVKYAAISVLCLLAFIAVNAVAGKLEGQWFPVVSDVQINQMEPSGLVSTRFWGSFIKDRNCDFYAITFNVGTPLASSVAPFNFEEGAGFRTPGRQDFGPWNVQLTPQQLASYSFSDASHRCPILPAPIDAWVTELLGFRLYRPWITETRFHP